MIKESSVIWITGLSGSGKTTTAKLLRKKLAEKNTQTILLDGDEVREVLGASTELFSPDNRKRLAYIYAKLGKLLCQQGFHVIISTISMFEEVRQWNRRNNTSYLEIYLDVSEENRKARDPKKLYAKNLPLVEVNNHYEAPKNPDLIFNDNQNYSPEDIVTEIEKQLFNNLRKYL